MDYEVQKHKSTFVSRNYHNEGFIHCCTDLQLDRVKERYFKDTTGLVLFHLDESKLKAQLRFEISTNGEKFPHLYGPINREAIIRVTSL